MYIHAAGIAVVIGVLIMSLSLNIFFILTNAAEVEKRRREKTIK